MTKPLKLPDRWFPLRYHEKQQKIWHSNSRFIAVAAGRGSGKTEIAKRKIVRWLPVKKPWKKPLYGYMLPTMPQAKRVAWGDLKELVPPEYIEDISETEHIITTIFGSELHLFSGDKPHRAEGVQWDGFVIDESSDIKPGTFDLSIRPALSHKQGWCMRIGVPKRFGVGALEFKKLFSDENWESYNWPSSDILPKQEIELAKKGLALKDYMEQYEASWVQAGGLAFYAFDKEKNVSRCTYDPTKRVIVGTDFNVNPMAWALMHKHDDHFYVFDEIFVTNTNTRECLDILWNRYGANHKGGWSFSGDAASRARKTAAVKASASDYLIIKNDSRFNARMHIPKSNPPVLDRLAATNMMLCNSEGECKVHIDPCCKHLIEDLEVRPIDDRGYPSEKDGEIGHITDALGYPLYMYAPLNRTGVRGSQSVHIITA